MRLAWISAAFWMLALSAHADDGCSTLFDDVRQEIETNYVGYAQLIANDPERLRAFRANVQIGASEAMAARDGACTPVLQRFLASLDDPHVFLSAQPELTATEAAAARAAGERRDLRTIRWRSPRQRSDLDGVWAASEFDAAVIAEGPRNRGRFIAVVLTSRDDAWAPGDVVARFQRAGDQWSAILYRKGDRAPLHVPAAVQRDGQMLHMPPHTWGRRLPMVEGATYRPEAPRAPGYMNINPNVALLTLPSFAPEHRPALEALLTAHDSQIQGRALLVIDLRGNEGGSALVGQVLAPYYYSEIQAPLVGPRVYPMALSSPRWIGYYSSIRDTLAPGDEREIYNDFLRRMEAAPGTLTPFFEDAGLAAQLYRVTPPSIVHRAPAHVAIIVDRHSLSAAEAFVLEAARSDRVTIFGEPTGGAIDFQSVAMSTVGAGRLRHWLGLPSSTASDEVPTRGLNATGVPVEVSLVGERDWMAAVLRHYGL